MKKDKVYPLNQLCIDSIDSLDSIDSIDYTGESSMKIIGYITETNLRVLLCLI